MVENVPGAGGLIVQTGCIKLLAYGLTIGHFNGGLVLGRSSETLELSLTRSVSVDRSTHESRHRLRIYQGEWNYEHSGMSAPKPVKLGATGPGSNIVMSQFLGLHSNYPFN